MFDEPEHINLSKGEVLFQEGDEGHTMYVVSEGELDVIRNVGGEDRVIASLGSGEFVGELSLLNHAPRSATIRAKEDSILLEYDEDAFEGLLANPAIARRLVYKMAERIKATNKLIV